MRVLVVEDEPLLADAVARGLRRAGFAVGVAGGGEPLLAEAGARGLRRAGFAVDVAGDGVDGLHQARETSYDAIVLDVMLPALGGLEVLRELRAAERWTPVLMLTAKDDDRDITAALDLGADDYL